MVAATYTREKGIFYGGKELSKSHSLLSQWLIESGLTKSVEELILLDVHSGLGPPGQDTLMVDENTALVRQVFDSHSFGANHLTPPLIEDESVKGGANDGYELTKGDTKDPEEGYPSLFSNLDRKKSMTVTQEFGTIPGVFVALA
eukprot:CAMPEP_0168603906 /NCGR_PEP_ID=MMETSP0420-20121227/14992_1 /TAXON_ID=498008 /ORGANISM="Pessonella sp." /LENGTH=144 /DNA_ID=CAMNT_0008642945 /DNA_START=300 /DNA_END=730 /DNA_ORIENTATION=+